MSRSETDHTAEILDAVAFAASRFPAAAHWAEAVPEVLERLGLASEASRVYVFQNVTDNQGRLCMDETFEWVADGVEPTMAMPDNHDWPYEDGYEHYEGTLGAGDTVQTLLSDTTGSERTDFEDEDIRSTAFVPIFVGDEWWGYLGLDDCTEERRFSHVEVAGLRAAASTLGAAIRRGRLEERARRAELRFRDLVEHIPAALYIDDPSGDGTSTYVGPQVEAILGISIREWLEGIEPWEGNIHPDDRDWVLEEWERHLKSHEPLTQEYRMIRPDNGAEVWIRDDTVFVLDSDGQVRAIQGVMTDVTSQKETEQALEAAQKLFKDLVENIPAVIYLDPTSSDQRTHYISPRVEELLGVTPEQYIEDVDTWVSMIHPDDREAAEDAYDRFLAGEGYETFTYRMIRPDGRIVWVQDTSRAVFDDNGEPVMVQGFFMDVTAQRQAEQALEEAQAQYQELVENIPAVVYIDPIEMSGDTLYVSPQIQQLLGVGQQEYLADSDMWFRMIHPDDRERVAEGFDRFIEGRGNETDVYRMVRPDGRVVWVQDNSHVVRDKDGTPLFIQGVWFDITAQKEAETELAEARAQYQSLVERIPVAVYTEADDADPDKFYMSPQIEHITGHPSEAFLDPNFWERHIHPDDLERVRAEDDRVVETGEPFSMDYRFVAADGRTVWLHEEARPFTTADGEQMNFGVISDITEQKEAEFLLGEAQEQYRSLVEGIPAVVYLDPPEGHEQSLYVSPQIESILGVSAAEYQADPDLWLKVIHTDDRERVREANEEHLTNGTPLSVEYRVSRPDGRITWVNEQAEVLLDPDGNPFLIQGVIFDITERKAAEERIAFLAYHDALTELANRALFEEMLDPALARARRNDMAVAVMFLDLDKFKEVNDTHGHAIGDELLKEVGRRLIDCVRETDIVARQGGDEFLVLLSDLDPGGESEIAGGHSRAVEVAEGLADRIRRAMRLPFTFGDVTIETSASIGVSLFPFDASDARTLLKHADAAMYESKKTRPGSFAMHARTGADPLVEDAMVWRLRRAVKEQAWDLHYQPVVHLRDGAIVGAEALLRWRRPEGGFVPPSDFIPLAEEMGLLEIIGEWVFEEICRQRTTWLRQGIDLTVGFNLSPRQLWQRDLVERLAMGLRSSGMDPADILIEVSESTAMTDPARTQRVLWALREEGFKIAIDDFGTGYSPVARIWHLPIDVLKIDQPLVRDLPDDAQVDSFVGAVIEFAREHGTVPHAEGIETPQQRAFLLEQGCEMGQGYLFSRPLPPEELTALWRKGEGRIET